MDLISKIYVAEFGSFSSNIRSKWNRRSLAEIISYGWSAFPSVAKFVWQIIEWGIAEVNNSFSLVVPVFILPQ